MNSRQTATSWDLSLCTGCISLPTTAIRLVGPEHDRLVSNVQTPNISSILFWSLDKAERKSIFGFFSFLGSFCLYTYSETEYLHYDILLVPQKHRVFFVKTSKDLIGCTVPLWLMAEICTRRLVGGDRWIGGPGDLFLCHN